MLAHITSYIQYRWLMHCIKYFVFIFCLSKMLDWGHIGLKPTERRAIFFGRSTGDSSPVGEQWALFLGRTPGDSKVGAVVLDANSGLDDDDDMGGLEMMDFPVACNRADRRTAVTARLTAPGFLGGLPRFRLGGVTCRVPISCPWVDIMIAMTMLLS